MLDTSTLGDWIVEALNEMNGSARLLEVVKRVWKNHQSEIEDSGDSFFTWQYDIRWAATMLRKQKKLKAAGTSPAGVWELPRSH
jgi:hypothetical protein